MLLELETLAQLDTQGLVGVVLRQVRHDHQDLRPLGEGQGLLAPALNRPQTHPWLVRLAHHGDTDALLHHLVGHREGDHRLDARVRDHGFLDFKGGDDLATPVDHLLRPPRDVQVPVRIDPTQVARVEPIAREEGLRRRLRIPLVAVEDRRTLDHDVAHCPARHLPALVAEDLELGADTAARGALAVEPVVQRRSRNGHALRHTIPWQHGATIGSPHLYCQRRQQAACRVGDESELVVREPTRLELIEDELMHHGACVVPSDRLVPPLHDVPKEDRVKGATETGTSSRQHWAEQVPRDAADMEERHHVAHPVRRTQFPRCDDASTADEQRRQGIRHALLGAAGAARE
mmetsp:Transcript_129003/g.412450  ORF Transcript_129003/g.412450 Transcript_129003/m.412450 type:complete len:347 (+) Transcript_129003:3112-4152(+)